MANPDPEIPYPLAKATRKDVIMATGRSDYPNQVNNVLGFPFIFRGALDVRATAINEEMKMAASHALAKLAKEDVPEEVLKAYGAKSMSFGREYLIPKPFDPRVLTWEAPAVAKAACDTGVARKPITDWDAYRESLERMLGPSRKVMHFVMRKAKSEKPKRLVFPEGEHDSIIRAARDIVDQKIAMPVLLGIESVIRDSAKRLGIEQIDFEIVNVPDPKHEEAYATKLYELRQRKGISMQSAMDIVHDPTICGLMMVQTGDADGFVGGMYRAYPETIRPAIQILGLKPGVSRVSAAHILVLKDRIFFCADTMVNISPNAEELAEIALLAADLATNFGAEPKVAMLAFSSFGSVPHPISRKMADAVDIVRKKNPKIVIDGEMHLDTAVVEEIVAEELPALAHQGRRERAGVPGPDVGQHRLQAGAAPRRRGGARADPAGRAQAGERAAARHDRGRHRQRGGHHRHVGGIAPDAGRGFSPGVGSSWEPAKAGSLFFGIPSIPQEPRMELQSEPVARTQMLIRRPVALVFEAFVDPAITSRFWFSRGSARLADGDTVTWHWDMYGFTATVAVKAVEPNRRILVEWPTPIEWQFAPRGDDATMVTITSSGFTGSGDQKVAQAIDMMGGFSFVLAGCKAYLEHGIELNLVADHAPDAHVKTGA